MKQIDALKILKTGSNVFLTGEPGSGKTYVINQYVNYLRSHNISPSITASTGIAATHIGGMTIHSWSGIGIKNNLNKAELKNIAGNDNVDKRITDAKILIIDEISMLPPDTLRMIEIICRLVKNNSLPFGGLQVILVGDFFQLPPIIKRPTENQFQDDLFDEKLARFAYDSPVWQSAEFATCYLDEQYRQDDTELSQVLTKIRTNNFDDSSLEIIRQRKFNISEVPSSAPKLYSHNIDVDRVNDAMLAKISAKAKHFTMLSSGKRNLVETLKKGCLSPENLFLKISAAVMFTKNNTKEGFVNGTLGSVVGFDDETELPIVKIKNGRKIHVSPADWTVEENGTVRARLTQIPLRLAWAITVHKSQGISLDEAVIDLSKVFEFGQGYVAISRVRRLTGIHLLGWNDRSFQVDPDVIAEDIKFRDDSTKTEKAFSHFSTDALQKIYDEFIKKSGGELKPQNGDRNTKTPKPSTIDETLSLWREGKTISQIAKDRSLSEGTIVSHLEKLTATKSINKTELSRIVSPRILTVLPKIQAAFDNQTMDKLSPIFKHCHGQYSYDELRIARMVLKSQLFKL
ncbi:AAA family ATPase [Candidatus Berkelbacteria bacterium CG10_big_fil_rev_8_21_14_0_10_43_13]|uniref:AAA family ATPase n=1 Tax=Candidatus Berkelbacteria bacterium CG10_big_fil_rev_8_21_14_0_10_43_13 TaxID=1974514 RepID=A0A2H0W6K3_9BACT|nr:MAG: AAA family ATPase [Candidatus Berkelbacteria bacterium CG10_big_fil_rev_8_21_14_0_10_43_13]